MDGNFQRALLRRLFELREAGTTSLADSVRRQSTQTYTDPQRFADELRVLFGRRPLIAGLSCDLPRAGEYFTVDLADSPVLVVRGEDGYVRAFLNACRHRGAPVATGRGHPGRVFKCPYHAWTYDIDGRLLGQPLGRDGFPGVQPDRFGLIPLPAAEAGGLIFVRPVAEGDPIDVTDELAGLQPELADHGFDDFAFFAERETVWDMNWKQPYETFLEAYHIFALHHGTLAKEVLSTPMLTDLFGPHGRGLLMGRQAARLLDVDEQEWAFRGHANLVYWLFPNTVLSMPMTGHAELWQFHPLGGSSARTRVTARFYTPGKPDTASQQSFWERMVDFTMGVVTSEDLAQQERIYTNIRSGLLPELVFGRNEPALVHYHRSLDGVLGTDTTVATPSGSASGSFA